MYKDVCVLVRFFSVHDSTVEVTRLSATRSIEWTTSLPCTNVSSASNKDCLSSSQTQTLPSNVNHRYLDLRAAGRMKDVGYRAIGSSLNNSPCVSRKGRKRSGSPGICLQVDGVPGAELQSYLSLSPVSPPASYDLKFLSQTVNRIASNSRTVGGNEESLSAEEALSFSLSWALLRRSEQKICDSRIRGCTSS